MTASSGAWHYEVSTGEGTAAQVLEVTKTHEMLPPDTAGAIKVRAVADGTASEWRTVWSPAPVGAAPAAPAPAPAAPPPPSKPPPAQKPPADGNEGGG